MLRSDVNMQLPSSILSSNSNSSKVYQSSDYYDTDPFGRASNLSSKALVKKQKSEARIR
jgi:hypothetical protein